MCATPSRDVSVVSRVLALAALTSCTPSLAITVELAVPAWPDPFDGVATVELLAITPGRVVVAGGGRWDQGPLDLPALLDPELERLVVVGLDPAGRILSSGASAPLDLLGAPPEGALQIFFSRAGELSETGARGLPRAGGSAVSLSSGRVLFLGGEDEVGCPQEPTELGTGAAEPLLRGPVLPGGHAGALHALDLGADRVLVLGGASDERCGVPAGGARPVLLDAFAGTSRAGPVAFEVPEGAAVVSVSDSLVIVAGGERRGELLDSVARLDPRSLEPAAPSRLGAPLADGSAVLVSESRVLFAGGRTGPLDASAVAEARVYDPLRGAITSEAIPLGAPKLQAALRVTGAGGVVLAGGRGSDGGPRAEVLAISVQPERSLVPGDTSTITSLPEPSSAGDLLDLDDGTMLYLPMEPGVPPAIVELLPASSRALARPPGVEGRLRGGLAEDGVVLLSDDRGALYSYNPGPARALGIFAASASFPGSADRGLGRAPLIPLRPGSWTLGQTELLGRLPPELASGGVIPGELVVLGATSVGDFDASFTLALEPLSQAAFVFGLAEGELDLVVFLGGLTLVARSRGRQAASPISCNALQTPGLAEPGPHELTIRRRGAEVRVDVDRDGRDDLVCATPGAPAGRLALGLITGEARFGRLDVSAYAPE